MRRGAASSGSSQDIGWVWVVRRYGEENSTTFCSFRMRRRLASAFVNRLAIAYERRLWWGGGNLCRFP